MTHLNLPSHERTARHLAAIVAAVAAFAVQPLAAQSLTPRPEDVSNIVHVVSTYEYRSAQNGPVQGRGVNSIQLFWDGTRWWIANATWDAERPDNPIPPELLPR